MLHNNCQVKIKQKLVKKIQQIKIAINHIQLDKQYMIRGLYITRPGQYVKNTLGWYLYEIQTMIAKLNFINSWSFGDIRFFNLLINNESYCEDYLNAVFNKVKDI